MLMLLPAMLIVALALPSPPLGRSYLSPSLWAAGKGEGGGQLFLSGDEGEEDEEEVGGDLVRGEFGRVGLGWQGTRHEDYLKASGNVPR